MVATNIFGATTAHADDDPSVPPGTEATATAPVEVDPNDPDLKLPDGATLAQAKVLDIKQVVEDQSGDERREDTNADVKFALQAEVLFGKDSAKLSGEAKSRISAIAEEIKTQNATSIRVFGFTDNLGSSAHGDVLSRQARQRRTGRPGPGTDRLQRHVRGTRLRRAVPDRGQLDSRPAARRTAGSRSPSRARRAERRSDVGGPRPVQP